MAGLQRDLPILQIDHLLYEAEDVKLSIQAATQMAERFGEDMAIRQDLSVAPLWSVQEPPLEIIRCPESLKKLPRTKIYRVQRS